MTPRRRIIVRRALARMEESGDRQGRQTLLRQYRYDGLDTCAVDGLCAGACPVDINTGDLVKRLRRENHSAFSNRIALWVARHFASVEWMVRTILRTGAWVNRIAGRNTMFRLTGFLRKIVRGFPLWSNQLSAPPDLRVLKEHPALLKEHPALPKEHPALKEHPPLLKDHPEPPQAASADTIVYFPTCISRVLGSQAPGHGSILQAFLDISSKAGIGVKIVDGIKGRCCGQIFGSKGFTDAYRLTADTIVQALWVSSSEGEYPVVTDSSSCAYTLYHLRPALSENNRKKFDRLILMDSLDYLHDRILPRCTQRIRKDKIVLHPVCSLQKTGTGDLFRKIAAHFADHVVVPVQAGCCGMAGDRGFLFPELTRSATHNEAKEAKDSSCDGYYSSTRTCEMALSEAVGASYESILSLVNECMLPAGARKG